VTIPSELSQIVVKKAVTFTKRLGMPIIGVVENMSGFVCPKCQEVTHILPAGGGRQIANSMHVPFLGSLPMDPLIAESGDAGRPFLHHYASTPTAQIMRDIITPILALDTFSG